MPGSSKGVLGSSFGEIDAPQDSINSLACA